jgi:mRNA interferase MazF
VTNPKRGDVYLVAFDPTRGAEIQKTRPALIVQNDIDNRYSPITITLPITSRFDAKLYPTEVPLPAGEGGLTVASVALANQIRAVDKHRLVRRLGKVGAETMREVERALQLALGMIEI